MSGDGNRWEIVIRDGNSAPDTGMRRCTPFVVMCMALIFWMASALPVSSATRNVIMLFDERRELPDPAALEAEFVSTLTSNSQDHIETYRRLWISLASTPILTGRS